MALFGSKKNSEEKAPKAAAKKAAPAKAAKPVKAKAVKAPKVAKASAPAVIPENVDISITSVILRPRITEKSGIASQSGVYTFEIAKSANKKSVAQAIKALYKVVPTKIAVINLPSKNVIVRGRRGVVSGTRKAMVTLKKGDTINFV